MNYTQLLQHIAQWIKENHNNEITGNILQDVLIQIVEYIKDNNDSSEIDIQDLQTQIDDISINQTINVFEGVNDPNIIPPEETFTAPDIYVQTNQNRTWLFDGEKWIDLTSETDVNIRLSEIVIPENINTKSQLVSYINTLSPSLEKLGNENWVLTNSNHTFFLIGKGKGKYGDNEQQIDVENIIEISGGGGGSATYTDDIPVILSSGKSLGRYTNGQTIPAAGKTMQEVMELIAQEYLTPSISSFAISQTTPIEVGTVISGNKNFTFSFSQSQNVKQNSVKIIDAMTNTVLADNLQKTSPQSVDIGTIVKLEQDSHVWRIEAENTQGATTQRNSSPVTWLFRWFFGGSDTDIVTSAQARALEDSTFSTGVPKQFVAGTGHTDFYFLIHDEAKIYSVTDLTALNADITSAYVLQGTMTVNDVGGNPHTYKKYKLSLASAYASPHTHEFIITYPPNP